MANVVDVDAIRKAGQKLAAADGPMAYLRNAQRALEGVKLSGMSMTLLGLSAVSAHNDAVDGHLDNLKHRHRAPAEGRRQPEQSAQQLGEVGPALGGQVTRGCGTQGGLMPEILIANSSGSVVGTHSVAAQTAPVRSLAGAARANWVWLVGAGVLSAAIIHLETFDNDEVNQSIKEWGDAARLLGGDQFGAALESVTPSDEEWDFDDRDAFDAFVQKLNAEIGALAEALNANKDALTAVRDHFNASIDALVGALMPILIAVIAAVALQAFPATAPLAQAIGVAGLTATVAILALIFTDIGSMFSTVWLGFRGQQPVHLRLGLPAGLGDRRRRPRHPGHQDRLGAGLRVLRVSDGRRGGATVWSEQALRVLPGDHPGLHRPGTGRAADPVAPGPRAMETRPAHGVAALSAVALGPSPRRGAVGARMLLVLLFVVGVVMHVRSYSRPS